VTRGQAARAGDSVRLELIPRGVECVDAGKVRAVGAATRDQIGVTVDEQRRAGVLRDWRERLDAIDQRPLVSGLKPQQHGRNLRAGKGASQPRRELGRVADYRRDQIEARGRARLRFFVSRCHDAVMVAQSDGKWAA